ncbi:MAG: hypothetical protein EOP83_35585, partial [Verrucomicrobiaceae bacterium]
MHSIVLLMRLALFAIVLSILSQAVSAADPAGTAYGALRIVGREQGEDSLNRVLEVKGRFGNPQPQVWKVTLKDSKARGALRELDIQRGRIISERTPVSRAVGEVMNFNQLNLDSDGVFTIANQAAGKASVTFDRADYTLRSGTQGGAPVWTVDFYEGRRGRVGRFEIAADSGTVLRQDLQNSRQEEITREDRDFLREEEDVEERRYADRDDRDDDRRRDRTR